MDHQELIAAAHVRSLATNLVNEKWLKVAEGLELNRTTQRSRDEMDRVKAEWFSQNTIDDYTVQAYNLLCDIAMLIRARK